MSGPGPASSSCPQRLGSPGKPSQSQWVSSPAGVRNHRVRPLDAPAAISTDRAKVRSQICRVRVWYEAVNLRVSSRRKRDGPRVRALDQPRGHMLHEWRGPELAKPVCAALARVPVQIVPNRLVVPADLPGIR